ncbi:hypothetical protein B0I35DRAFT_90978 [Stachybotrys elegans]|uniref:PH domain-containing protein n=1 Tax=Stachybotrys elegans TaxID=80388 RepID=A0A8K0SMR7_9HYPO|nr:hypothetical protein B0I35DRAFT_90978 [Stachybotrys elegans]
MASLASSLGSDKPTLPAPNDGDNDPFVSSTPAHNHHRYADFDEELFAAGPGTSPSQAKRALEAHLAETDRRLEEAGKLGTALVSQRKALAEQLQEVNKAQAEGELNPDLRRKLVDIEKDFNDLAKESARVFLPKPRVPSNEANPGSPFLPEGRGGRRSVSPHKFESQATGSPTKLSVPNRKIRNQPSNRVHDIEFAAEISQSLITQVRNLQALLAERDEEMKDIQAERSQLELDVENLQQRVKILDESEHRYKEENWNLETRLQEVASQQREAADREKKLTQALNLSKAEKTSTQKELDEVKLSHAKLVEEHAAAVKHHDIELGTAKRNIVMAEGERSAMQRKIDDLTNQNQELAKAFSATRGRTLEREMAPGTSDEDFDTAADSLTPEHSPPPSPVKGTPRHSMLETETMKSSLQHAQRTIQSQRSQLHREKTEKLELRRLVQDLRDDLEKARSDASHSGSTNRRSRKVDSREFKKPPPKLFGSFRTTRQEIIMDDPDWEDTNEPALAPRQAARHGLTTDSSDHFETANEDGESAFETANEPVTDTDFVTGNEDISGSDDTETEGTRGFGRMNRPPSLPFQGYHSSRPSIESTASTSADEDDSDIRTPMGTITSAQRNRFRNSRALFRSSRQGSEEPAMQSSPASANFGGSVGGGTPQVGQSLFAELQDMSDDDSLAGGQTPSRRSARSLTPGSTRRAYSPPPAVPALPKVIMVDSGMMTDPIVFADVIQDDARTTVSTISDERPRTMESVIGPNTHRASTSWLSVRESEADMSRPVSTHSYSDASAQHDPELDARLSQFPVPPTSFPQLIEPSLEFSDIQSESIEPVEQPLAPVVLNFTPYITEETEPVEEPRTPVVLNFTPFVTEETEPVLEPETPPPTLSLSTINFEHLEPKAEPVAPPPVLTVTSILTEMVEPIAEPEVPAPELSMSSIAAENIEPVAEPVVLPPALSISSIAAEGIEPVAIPPPALSLSDIAVEDVKPVAEPEILPPALTLSSITQQEVEPVEVPEVPAPLLSLSGITNQVLEPIAEPEVARPVLGMSAITSEEVEPVSEPEVDVTPAPMLAVAPEPEPVVEPVELTFSGIYGEDIEPIAEPVPEPEPVPAPPALTLSTILQETVAPIAEPEILPPALVLSDISSEVLEPQAEPEVVPAPPPVPDLSLSTIVSEIVEPIAEPEVPMIPLPAPPTLLLSPIMGEQVEPVVVEAVAPELTMTSLLTEVVDPVSEPEVVVLPPPLTLSSIHGEQVEPREEIQVQPALAYSTISSEHVAPVSVPEPSKPSLGLSAIVAENLRPIAEPSPSLPTLALSNIVGESVEPVSPEAPATPNFNFTGIASVETVPISPRSPWREAFVLPGNGDGDILFAGNGRPKTPTHKITGSALDLGKKSNSPLIIAEDETSQSPSNAASADTPESQRPFREISSNTNAAAQRAFAMPTSDHSAQTALTSGEIDKLVKSGAQSHPSHGKTLSISTVGSAGTTDTVKIHRPQESFGSPVQNRGKVVEDYFGSGPIQRPGSATSGRASLHDAPPLPSNHREVIQAARSGSSQGNMGPPLWPASAMKNRPRTPNSARPTSPLSVRATPTPKVVRSSSTMTGQTDAPAPPKYNLRSRQSSVSSFASELDTRFNIRPSEMGMDPTGLGSNTDPRMIQAITQTMIGEYLWKYTRKTGRGEMSENRHRRYFWVHPYTRTLYWCEQDPSTTGRTELKTKSVPIEAVRVVTDDNPMPPGLHRKSLVVISPGRTIKFTCTTGQRHETWFNALSYLLLRTDDGQADAQDMAENITSEDVDEFNPQMNRRPANGNRPGPPSLSSYNSRASHNASPAGDMSYNIPTLTPSTKRNASVPRTSTGTLGKISGYWRSGGFGSLRGRSTSGLHQSIYEASEVHDSAEDLREMIEQQDREADRLENVRACCDGKHDVGTLGHHSKRGRVQHSHSHPTPSTTPTPMASMRSRA